MSKIKNNEITHTGNSGTSNIVLGSSGQVTMAGDFTPSKLKLGSDAAGDTMYSNGTQYVRLAKGSAGQVLKMNAGATAPEWGAAGGGKVVGLSIGNSTTNNESVSGATTWTLVGPQITYTAASSSNKLIFLHNHHMTVEDMTWRMALFRDGTSGTNLYEMTTRNQSAIWQADQGIKVAAADAPDTSSHTYQFAIYRDDGSDERIKYSPNATSTGSQVILLELEP